MAEWMLRMCARQHVAWIAQRLEDSQEKMLFETALNRLEIGCHRRSRIRVLLGCWLRLASDVEAGLTATTDRLTDKLRGL